MRSETKTHLSVVDGKPRMARVTVGACHAEERALCPERPEYLLNDRAPSRLTREDEEYIRTAQAAADSCWAELPHGDEIVVVLKIDLPIVDMHLEAVKAAAADATQALFPR